MADRSGSGPPFRELAEPIAALTQRIVARRGFPHALLIRRWSDIVGPEIAHFSLPECIEYPPRRRTGGRLVIRVSSPSLAVEIQHNEPAIVEAFNLLAGVAAITGLRLRHGPLPPTSVGRRVEAVQVSDAPSASDEEHETLSDIGDPELREALRSLRRVIAHASARR